MNGSQFLLKSFFLELYRVKKQLKQIFFSFLSKNKPKTKNRIHLVWIRAAELVTVFLFLQELHTIALFRT